MSYWTPERKHQLRQLWEGPMTAREIGELMGISRNAVIGKVHALSLPEREKGNRKQRMTREEAEVSLADYKARHRGQTHIRKSYAALGDDTTLSRFVKVKGTEPSRQPKQLQLGNLRHKAFEQGRSIFSGKGVKNVADVTNVLVSGHSNVKIGRDVRKGPLRGYYIFTLTLEERATCPSTCFHWTTCYGNHMPWAKRVSHRDPKALERAIQRDLVRELGVRGRVGVLVRLHALGDFFDEDYVDFWANMLATYPNLAVFGYTARRPWDQIGAAIQRVKEQFGQRFAIRWSDGQCETDATVPISQESECPPNAFVCPEQTGRSQCCATCGLCWTAKKNVAFIEH